MAKTKRRSPRKTATNQLTESHKNRIIALYRLYTAAEIINIIFKESGIRYTDSQLYAFIRILRQQWLNQIDELRSIGQNEKADESYKKLIYLLPTKRVNTLELYNDTINKIINEDQEVIEPIDDLAHELELKTEIESEVELKTEVESEIKLETELKSEVESKIEVELEQELETLNEPEINSSQTLSIDEYQNLINKLESFQNEFDKVNQKLLSIEEQLIEFDNNQSEFNKVNQKLLSIEETLVNTNNFNIEIRNIITNGISNLYNSVVLKETTHSKSLESNFTSSSNSDSTSLKKYNEDTYLEIINNFKSKHDKIKIVLVGIYQDRIRYMNAEEFAIQYADIVDLRYWVMGKGTHSQLKAMCKNADVVYGITANLSHNLDSVVSKIPNINYIRLTEGMSSVKKTIIKFIETKLVNAI